MVSQKKSCLRVYFLIVISFLAVWVTSDFARPAPVLAEDSDHFTVVLYKVLLDAGDTTSLVNSSGQVEVDTQRLLNDVEFTVYDVTTLIAAGQTENTLYWHNESDGASYFAQQGLTVSKGITGQDGVQGQVKFDLAMNSHDQPAKYLIIETRHSIVAGQKIAQPIYLANPEATALGRTIYLYPKSYQYVRNAYFYVRGKDGATGQDLGPLAHADFVLYKEDDQGNRYYLHKELLDNHGVKWVSDAKDPNVKVMTSAESGLVSTDDHWLPAGDYYFQGVALPKGWVMSDDKMHVKVTVPTDSTAPVLATIKGKVSGLESTYIYLLKQAAAPQPTPTPQLPTTKGLLQQLLPNTGEKAASYMALVVCLVTLIIFVRSRRAAKAQKAQANDETADD
jgi:hypothetical protein